MKKRYVKFLTVLFACTLLLSACKGSNSDTQTDIVNTSNTSKSKVSSGTQESNSPTTDLAVNPDSDFEYKYDSDLQGVVVGYKGTTNTVHFPDTINGDPVVSISQTKTSVPSSITAVSIPEGVKVIGAGAFDGYTRLTSITIPDSVTNIDYEAFNGCTGLTSISIPDSVTNIENSAFQGCKGLTSVTIPESVTRIGDETFMDCYELTSVTIPDSVTSIGYWAFYGCKKLKDITVPDTADIDSEAFNSTYWYDRQADGFICIRQSLLGYKGETPATIAIPDGITKISAGAFQNCSELMSATIPDSVTNIADSAFIGCKSLDEATKSCIQKINPNVKFD